MSNKGIELASGELVGIINSDDMLTDDSLNIIANNIKPEVKAATGRVKVYTNECMSELARNMRLQLE